MNGSSGPARWPLPVAAALMGMGGLTGLPALFAVGAGLALATVGAWAVVLFVARRLDVSRTVQSREVREDEPLIVHFDIRGAARLPVTLDVRDATGAWLPLAVGGDALDMPSGPRGAHRLAPSVLRVRDLLGIAERRLRAGEPEPILVLPRPQAGDVLPATHTSPRRDPEPDGLEAYVPGTPVARIHWPSIARGAGLHARRVTASPGTMPLVLVETAGDPDRDAVDWTARVAAGQILRFAQAGGCRVLLPGDRSPTTIAHTAAWTVMHRRLAMLTASEERWTPPFAVRDAVVRIAASRAPRAQDRA